MTAERWAALIERHYRGILVGSLLLCVLAGLSLLRMRLDVDVLGMLPRGEPAFDDFRTFVADFGELDELFILIDGPRPEREQVAATLTTALARIDGIGRVQGRIDTAGAADALLGPYLANFIPLDAYPELRERLTPAGIAAQVAADKLMLAAPFDVSLARNVSEDPLGLRRIAGRALARAAGDALPDLSGGYLTSRDGGALLLIARPTGSPFDGAFTARLLAQVEQAVAATRSAAPDGAVRIALTGSYLFAQEDAATMKADIQRYGLLSLFGVLAVFWLGYGNLRVLPFVAYPLLFSTLLAFALSLIVYAELNALSLSFAAILYGLTIDSGIHFYSRLAQSRQHGDARAAIAETLRSLGGATIASSTTTAAGFFVIALSCLAVVQQLGMLTAIGMLVTVAEFFVLYPALGFLLLHRGVALPVARETPRLGAWAAAAQRRAPLVRAALAVGSLAAGLGAVHVSLDSSLQRLRPSASPALRVQEEIAARFTRSDRAGAVLVGGSDTEAALVAAETVAARLQGYRDAGLLRSVQTIDALLPSAAVQRERLAAFNALPRAEAAQTLREALRGAGFKPERFAPFFQGFAPPRDEIVTLATPALAPFAPALERHVRVHPAGTMVAAYAEPADAVPWSDVAARVRGDLPALSLAIAARPLLEERLHDVLRRELRGFLLLATLANLALLVLVLRTVPDALAVLAPVLVVVAAIFALMAAAGLAVDPVNLVVTPLLLGIGVDNGIYVVTARREFGGVAAALRLRGRAICVTSATTIVGFGFLALSAYPPLASLGTLMALGLILSLAATIFVLPALLRR